MSDIGSRIGRYRLSRYAIPLDPVRRRLRWFWLVVLAWVAGFGGSTENDCAPNARSRSHAAICARSSRIVAILWPSGNVPSGKCEHGAWHDRVSWCTSSAKLRPTPSRAETTADEWLQR
jgi:hypothetical protein